MPTILTSAPVQFHSFTTCHPYLLCFCLIVKTMATSGPLHWPFSEPEMFIPKISRGWLLQIPINLSFTSTKPASLQLCHFDFSLNATFSKRTCLTSLSKWFQPFFFFITLLSFAFSICPYLMHFKNLFSIPQLSPIKTLVPCKQWICPFCWLIHSQHLF